MADAHPINVTLTLESESAASAVVGPEGGTVAATSATGVTYTLTLPPDAVSNTHQVVLTPVAAFNGLPLSGAATAGVSIEPDGIQLAAIGTLEVSGAPAANEAFTFHGGGNDLARWIAAEEGIYSLPVLGFAGFGLAPDTTGPADWRPGDPATRVIHEQAASFYANSGPFAMVGSSFQLQDALDDTAVVDALCQASHGRMQRALGMRGQALADPLGVGVIAVQEMFAAARSSAVGCEIEIDFQAIAEILTAAARELSRRCETRTHDPIRTFHRAISLVRQAQLIGISGPDYDGILSALSGVRSCTQYQLFLDATIDLTVHWHFYVADGDQYDVEGTVVSGRHKLPLVATTAETTPRFHERLPLQIRSESWGDSCWTGRPFDLRGGTSGGPPVLDARAEPVVDQKRIVNVNGLVEVPDESGELNVMLRIQAYALMPAKETPECEGLNPLLWDIGGSFLGAAGTVPFRIPIAGVEKTQTSEGQTFITPPGTDQAFEDSHHAIVNGVYRFTSDNAGAGLDFEQLFGAP